MKDKKNIVKIITIIAFFLFLVTFPIISAFLPKEEMSEIENKKLQTIPKISTDNILSRKFMSQAEDYISDHFVGRIEWIKFKHNLDYLFGKREINNIYLLKDRLIEKVSAPNYDLIDKSISGINKLKKDNKIPVYILIAPTSADIYSGNAPYGIKTEDLNKMVNYVYNNLDSDIYKIDIYSDMMKQKDNYIYYRTDHHWTSYGAFIAYQQAGKVMGYNPLSIDDYNIETASTDFLGTFYSKSLYDKIQKDNIDFYHADRYNIKSVEVTQEFGKDPEVYKDIYFREFITKKDKYSAFLGTNQPIVTIKTDCPGDKLLIIKDSYAHSFVPFLTQHYSEITMLYLRYVQISYNSVIDIDNYDKVLFLYNDSTFSTDENIKKLNYN